MTDLKNSIAEALQLRFGEAVTVPDETDGLRTLAGLASHRTYRHYSNRPLPPDLLRLLYACALSAPSKSDLQQADIVEITDPELRASIAELIPSMPWIQEAPAFVIVCGSGRRIRQISSLRDKVFANDHLDAFFNAALDAGLVLSQLMVAAEAVGLGTCPISVVRDHAERVSELLELPSQVFPAAGLCLGWPEEDRRLSPRLPLALTLQCDRYREEGWVEHVEAYDRRRGVMDGWDPNSPEFRGWSQRKAHMYAESQRADFGAFVRRRGFCLD